MGTIDDSLRILYSNNTVVIGPRGKISSHGIEVISACLNEYVSQYITKSGCVSRMNFITGHTAYDDGTEDEKYAGIYKSSEFNSKYIPLFRESTNKLGKQNFKEYLSHGVTPEAKELRMLYNTGLYIRARWGDDNVSDSRSLFQECPGDQYFYVPFEVVPVEEKYSGSHANGLILSKAKGTVMRIEPAYKLDTTRALDQKINEGMIKFANEIGLKDPTWVEFEATCPQAITVDDNCIFWTLLLFKTVLENLNKDPNVVVKELSTKPKEELSALIEGFKTELRTKIIPEGLKLLNLTWPDFEKMKTGGNLGNRKSKIKTKRKIASRLRKTKVNRNRRRNS